MFGLSKKTHVHAPCAGAVCELSAVDDPVFSEGMVGEGFALAPESAVVEVTAPVDGELVTVFPTGHAFALKTAKGLEVLVHIGIDTVGLKGEGFEVLAQKGATVTQGTPIVRVDVPAIEQAGLSTLIPVVMTNKKQVKSVAVHAQEGATTDTVGCDVTMA